MTVTHVVLMKIRSEVTQSTIADLYTHLADLKSKIHGLLAFSGGPYSSMEGLNKGKQLACIHSMYSYIHKLDYILMYTGYTCMNTHISYTDIHTSIVYITRSTMYNACVRTFVGFTHAFVMEFATAEDRNVYLVHPDHEVVKNMVLAVTDDVIAFDYMK